MPAFLDKPASKTTKYARIHQTKAASHLHVVEFCNRCQLRLGIRGFRESVPQRSPILPVDVAPQNALRSTRWRALRQLRHAADLNIIQRQAPAHYRVRKNKPSLEAASCQID